MQRGANRSWCRLLRAAVFFSLITFPAFALQNPARPDQAAAPSAPQPLINPDGTYRPGNGVTNPRLIYAADAEFSNAARRKKISSVTVIALIVGTDGLPREVHVARSAAAGVKPKLRKAAQSLDPKAVEAAKEYRFEPGTYKGKPVPVALTVEVNFHIY